MPRPTLAELALVRSNLPTRRVAAPQTAPSSARSNQFASILQAASTPAPRMASMQAMRPIANPTSSGGPGPMSRSQMLENAQQLIGVPYVWGGNTPTGLDCSTIVSRVWGVSRHTTDTLAEVARPIGKDELQPGDALNLTTTRDDDGRGHVRLFDRWANPERTSMWVYEQTPPRSVHHIIKWDPSYTPVRRLNVVEA